MRLGLATLVCATIALAPEARALPRWPHAVDVRLVGPVAVVTVERALAADTTRRGEEVAFDVDLPEGAVPLGWELLHAKQLVRAAGTEDEAGARARHKDAVLARGERPTKVPLEEGTGYRVRVAGAAGATLRYRYAALLGCERGRFVLRVPGSLEPEPTAAEVTVRAAGGTDRVLALEIAGAPVRVPRGGGAFTAHGRAPARASWEIALSVAEPDRRVPAQMLAAVGARHAAVALCRGDRPAEAALPSELLFVLDRSRSVGMPGMVAMRELSRALLELLPPSVKFNAVVFDRKPEPLFPGVRASTLEAIGALETAASPGGLRNGTDLVRALRAAADQVRAERTPGERVWIVLLTDGSVPDGQDASTVARAVDGLDDASVDGLVLIVRPDGDERPVPAEEAAVRALPARYGGVARAVSPGRIADGVREAIAAMRKGGDLFDVAVVGAGGRVAGAVGAGAGAARVVRAAGEAFTVRATFAGRTVTRALRPSRLDTRTLAPLLAPKRVPAWTASTAAVSLLVERGPAPADAPDEIVRGQMDKQVVRNALSLAFMPRARACYLDRRVATPKDLSVRGRVRLELHLERGEMVDAQVKTSTLGRPDIESCLREAAFAVEIPRPLHRDAPVIAALNLVFQPHTPEPGARDAGGDPDPVDILLGPVTFPSDPRELLLDAPGSP